MRGQDVPKVLSKRKKGKRRNKQLVDLYNKVQCNVELRINRVLSRRQIPFGWLGYAVLPKAT